MGNDPVPSSRLPRRQQAVAATCACRGIWSKGCTGQDRPEQHLDVLLAKLGVVGPSPAESLESRQSANLRAARRDTRHRRRGRACPRAGSSSPLGTRSCRAPAETRPSSSCGCSRNGSNRVGSNPSNDGTSVVARLMLLVTGASPPIPRIWPPPPSTSWARLNGTWAVGAPPIATRRAAVGRTRRQRERSTSDSCSATPSTDDASRLGPGSGGNRAGAVIRVSPVDDTAVVARSQSKASPRPGLRLFPSGPPERTPRENWLGHLRRRLDAGDLGRYINPCVTYLESPSARRFAVDRHEARSFEQMEASTQMNCGVETVPRQGYQFVAIVTALSNAEGDSDLDLLLAPHRAWTEGRRVRRGCCRESTGATILR